MKIHLIYTDGGHFPLAYRRYIPGITCSELADRAVYDGAAGRNDLVPIIYNVIA